MSCDARGTSQPVSRCSCRMERRSNCASITQQSANHNKKFKVADSIYMKLDAVLKRKTGSHATNIADTCKEPLESAMNKESRLREELPIPLIKEIIAWPVMRKKYPSAKPCLDCFPNLLNLVGKTQKSKFVEFLKSRRPTTYTVMG